MIEDSVKYSNHPTIVRFSAEKRGEELVLIYEDQGPGIPLDSKEKIFDHRNGKSSGIGLPLCREILMESDMFIREVGTPGKGVRFEISVPSGHYRVS